MTNAVVSVRNVAHRYERNYVLKNINLEIRQGDTVGLLGANGAGKSTLMNILCGVINATGGEVLFDSALDSEIGTDIRASIGYLPQQPPLHVELTIKEFLMHAAHLRGIRGASAEEAVHRAIEECELASLKDRLINNLSGGYRQRVGIAQAIIHSPRLVILDEPTNGLDPNQIVVIRKLIKAISKNRTVLISTHILREVEALCDRIVMLDHGNLIFSGSLNEFRSLSNEDTVLVKFERNLTDEQLYKIIGRESQLSRGDAGEIYIKNPEVSKIIKDLVSAEREQMYGLLEIRVVSKSLEEVFTDLTASRRK